MQRASQAGPVRAYARGDRMAPLASVQGQVGPLQAFGLQNIRKYQGHEVLLAASCSGEGSFCEGTERCIPISSARCGKPSRSQWLDLVANSCEFHIYLN